MSCKIMIGKTKQFSYDTEPNIFYITDMRARVISEDGISVGTEMYMQEDVLEESAVANTVCGVVQDFLIDSYSIFISPADCYRLKVGWTVRIKTAADVYYFPLGTKIKSIDNITGEIVLDKSSLNGSNMLLNPITISKTNHTGLYIGVLTSAHTAKIGPYFLCVWSKNEYPSIQSKFFLEVVYNDVQSVKEDTTKIKQGITKVKRGRLIL